MFIHYLLVQFKACSGKFRQANLGIAVDISGRRNDIYAIVAVAAGNIIRIAIL